MESWMFSFLIWNNRHFPRWMITFLFYVHRNNVTTSKKKENKPTFNPKLRKEGEMFKWRVSNNSRIHCSNQNIRHAFLFCVCLCRGVILFRLFITFIYFLRGKLFYFVFEKIYSFHGMIENGRSRKITFGFWSRVWSKKEKNHYNLLCDILQVLQLNRKQERYVLF